MSKHTDEPWVIKHRPGGPATGVDAIIAEEMDCEAFNLSSIKILKTGFECIFDPREDGREARALSDAQIMGNALELLEALELAEGHLAEMLGDPKWHPIGHCPVLDRVRAVLAKARGE